MFDINQMSISKANKEHTVLMFTVKN